MGERSISPVAAESVLPVRIRPRPGQHRVLVRHGQPGRLNVSCNGGSYCAGTSAAYHDGSRYQFCTDRTCTWEDADAGCRNAGGHLVSLIRCTAGHNGATALAIG